jgi:threonine/homoserine/homoserine lactone efflux protein
VLPYGLAAAAAAPIVAVVTALILARSARPLLSAWVFTAGAAALDVVFAIGLLVAANASGAFDDGGSDAGAIVDLVLGALFLALGLKAVFSRESAEAQAAQRKRIERAAAGGLRGMLITGVAAQVINVDALTVFTGAIKETAEADVSTPEAAVALAIALSVMLIPYYVPAVLYAISPQRSGVALRRMSDWLLDHSRMLEIVVGIGFGAIFLTKGIASL